MSYLNNFQITKFLLVCRGQAVTPSKRNFIVKPRPHTPSFLVGTAAETPLHCLILETSLSFYKADGHCFQSCVNRNYCIYVKTNIHGLNIPLYRHVKLGGTVGFRFRWL